VNSERTEDAKKPNFNSDEAVEENNKSEEVELTEEEKLQEEIAELKQKLKESDDKFLRTHADFENIKKRLEREKYSAIDYASEKFAKDLIPILDTLAMAIQSAETNPDLEKLKEGVELTLKKFIDTMEKHNITEVSTEEGFDPNMHEAVMRVDSDEVESGEIVQVLQKGYKLKERVLRATMVSVAN
jgi:molecular chaperone GrpE